MTDQIEICEFVSGLVVFSGNSVVDLWRTAAEYFADRGGVMILAHLGVPYESDYMFELTASGDGHV